MATYYVNAYYEYRKRVKVTADSPEEAKIKGLEFIDELFDGLPTTFVGYTEAEVLDDNGEVVYKGE